MKKAELYANEGKANEMRKDQEGALMKWSDYGENARQSKYGWEIDHKKPESKRRA